MKLQELTRQTYQEELKKLTQFSFMQTKEMSDFLDKQGYQTYHIGLCVNGKFPVIASLYSRQMFGGLRMELYAGPIYKDPRYLNTFYKQLQQFAKENNVLELLVRPYDHFQTFDKNGLPTSTPKHGHIKKLINLGFSHDGLSVGYGNDEATWHFLKDLSQLNEQDLFKSYNKNGQRLVKKARQAGVKIKKLERHELTIFKEIQDSTAKRQNYDAKSLRYYENLYDTFGDQIDFLTATICFKDYLAQLIDEQKELQSQYQHLEELCYHKSSPKLLNKRQQLLKALEKKTVEQEKIASYIEQFGDEEVALASNIVLYSTAEITYLCGGFYTEYDFLAAPSLLQDVTMREGLKRGIPIYNFLGIQGKFDGSDGVLRFKQNFNGYIVRKMGTFRYYPKPITFKTIQYIKKVLVR
ncbi:peptidoglycan bridge formation glycyltransferase FemA/FemB family protein [Streptococcus saliviloxodontae]|uniref:Alanine adding enzyme n=1 Tax=Streptococcus saliviloxodontae TaxID=1349416 RepID=A0ABS2PNB6_9STRE|nr:peptidoglycan bridge formation glycyltransferase FemA/FemB family protein [Streptococcus saliviloxodontae]MBM7636298.1 alanine adding enzyme [Streptococcus saliviloxodontae]